MNAGHALAQASIPRAEALLLLAHASGRTRESLLASPDTLLSPSANRSYEALHRRRLAGEPIAYLVGAREFYGRRFVVDPAVLIPRPETELLVDLAIEYLRGRTADAAVVDLGTGSGVIAITLALEVPSATVTGTDVSTEALRVARANGRRLRAAVAWHAGTWFDALVDRTQRFDLIVSNPPYIAADDRHLQESDLRFEPPTALTDGHDGLAALRAVIRGAPLHLQPGGSLMVEHGHDQAEVVRALLGASGFVDVASMPDLAGIERVTVGRGPVATRTTESAAV